MCDSMIVVAGEARRAKARPWGYAHPAARPAEGGHEADAAGAAAGVRPSRLHRPHRLGGLARREPAAGFPGRAAAAMVRLRPGVQAQAGLGTAQRDVNQALHQAQDSAADWHGSINVAGRLAMARRQLAALRLRVAGGSLSVPDISTSYGTRVNEL